MKSRWAVCTTVLLSCLPFWAAALKAEVSDGNVRITPEQREQIEAAIPKQAPGRPARTRRLLVVTLNVWDGKERNGHASIPYGNLAIELMGSRTGAYETVFSNDIAVFRPENLRQFDAVCFNNTVGVLFEDEDLRKSLLDFVRGGKGFIGIHAAGATFVQWPRYDFWPEFGQMLGGWENGGHPWKPDEPITLKIDDPGHPVNAAFAGKGFEICDEVFQFQKPWSRKDLHVLLSIDTDKTDMNPNRRFLAERYADKDFAISWVKSCGKGRVFYSSLGHNPHIFWNGPVLEHFLAGIQFALGDLPASTAPGESAELRTPGAGAAYAYHVDCANGDAANPGTAEKPWRSLTEALASGRLAAGDRVILHAGDYGEIKISGQNEDFITLQASDSGHVFSSGIKMYKARFWRIRGLTVRPRDGEPRKYRNLIEIGKDSSDIVVEGCTLYSVKDSSDWSSEDWVSQACNGIAVNGTRVRIEGNHVLNTDFGINVSGTHNVVTNNVVENFSGDGMRALGDDCIFRRNIIKNCYDVDDNHDDGIQSWSTGPGGVGTGVVRNVILDGNVIINTTDPQQRHRGTLQGIGCFDGMFENWLIVNNIIVVDHFHGISLYGARNCRILNNTVVDNRPGRPVPWIMITKHKKGMPSTDNIIRNNLTQQPISPRESNRVDHNVVISDLEAFFVNPHGFDCQLKPGCAAIDAGLAEGIAETDFLGHARVYGATVDAGAIEYRP